MVRIFQPVPAYEDAKFRMKYTAVSMDNSQAPSGFQDIKGVCLRIKLNVIFLSSQVMFSVLEEVSGFPNFVCIFFSVLILDVNRVVVEY